MYDELVRSLRICAEGEHCDKCTKWEAKQNGGLNVCLTALCKEAADAIEELMRFAYFVAREVVVTDEEWELNNLAFPEIICRKLNNLGVVSKAGEMWHYEPPEEE